MSSSGGENKSPDLSPCSSVSASPDSDRKRREDELPSCVSQSTKPNFSKKPRKSYECRNKVFRRFKKKTRRCIRQISGRSRIRYRSRSRSRSRIRSRSRSPSLRFSTSSSCYVRSPTCSTISTSSKTRCTSKSKSRSPSRRSKSICKESTSEAWKSRLRPRPLKSSKYPNYKCMFQSRGCNRNCSNTEARKAMNRQLEQLNAPQTNENAVDMEMTLSLSEEASDNSLMAEPVILVSSVSGDAPDGSSPTDDSQ